MKPYAQSDVEAVMKRGHVWPQTVSGVMAVRAAIRMAAFVRFRMLGANVRFLDSHHRLRLADG